MHYFNSKIHPGFVALFSGRMIQFAGLGLTGLFLPVFLFTQLNFSFSVVAAYYIIGFLSYGMLLPLGAHYLNRFGFQRAIRASVILDALYYICMFMMAYEKWIFLLLSIPIFVLARMLFWLPYNVDLAKFTDKNDRGKGIGLIWATKSFLDVAMPIVAGVLLGTLGFHVVFIISIIIYLLAGIPFMALPHANEKFSWTYVKTFRKFFAKENRKLVAANMANGAEGVVAMVIWPIFIWQVLKGNYYAVGAVSSLIVLFGVIIQLFVGRFCDVANKRLIIKWGSVLYSSGWALKVFVISSFHIFVAGAWHTFAGIFKNTSFDALNFEILADHGHYVDEYTVLKEMAIQFGRVLILLAAIVISLLFGINWTFALAALASLLIMLL
jgi:MFS family permease